MNVFNWMIGQFSNRGRAVCLYKRGMRKARKHNHEGAIDDYTAAIVMPDMPTELKAMALYHRALMHLATGGNQKGILDLEAVLAMDKAMRLVNVKTMARQKLAGMDPRFRKSRV